MQQIARKSAPDWKTKTKICTRLEIIWDDNVRWASIFGWWLEIANHTGQIHTIKIRPCGTAAAVTCTLFIMLLSNSLVLCKGQPGDQLRCSHKSGVARRGRVDRCAECKVLPSIWPQFAHQTSARLPSGFFITRTRTKINTNRIFRVYPNLNFDTFGCIPWYWRPTPSITSTNKQRRSLFGSGSTCIALAALVALGEKASRWTSWGAMGAEIMMVWSW